MVWLDPGPDSGWSWVVAAACWLVQLFTNGLLRSQGVLYVAVIENLGVSRQDASWPFGVCIASACFSGLSVGFLTQFFSIRQVVFLCGFLVSLGYFLCYFLPFSIFWITLSYGVIAGAGTGLVTPSLAVVTNDYFHKDRASSNGISLAGITCGAFVFPSLVNYLIGHFGLRGTFLVMGSLILNIFVGAALLRPRDSRHFPVLAAEDQLSSPPPESASLLKHFPVEDEGVFRRIRSLVVQTLMTPMFYLVSFSALSSVFVLMIFVMIVPDFAVDVGVVGDKSAMLLAAFSLPDLLGRLGTGWLSDKKFIKRKHVFAAAKTFSGLVLLAFPFISGDVLFVTLCVILGLLEGSATILINVLFVEYLGLKRLAMALSIWSFAIGIVFLLTPPIIGLFRDSGGSYNSIFFLMCAVSLLSGLLWSLEPLLVRRRKDSH